MTMYFDEFAVGQVFTTPERSVTAADVGAFADLTGDDNPLHTDPEFAARTQFGGLVAHGVFGISLALGLAARTGVFTGSAAALLGVDGWRFHSPVRVGDAVHARIEIVSTRLTSSGRTGVVGRHFELVDSLGVVAQSGRMDVLVYTAEPPDMKEK